MRGSLARRASWERAPVSNLILYSIPAFVALLLIEVAWAGVTRRSGLRDQGHVREPIARSHECRINAVTKLAQIRCSCGCTSAASSTFRRARALAWLVLFFAEDCCYYWFHRMHTRCAFSGPPREPPLEPALQPVDRAAAAAAHPFTGPWFWMPLPLLGFPPHMIMTMQAISLIYQFWLHTESIDRLGPLEWVLNTPSHHRCTTARTSPTRQEPWRGPDHLDRLFGTFAREDERVVYGLTRTSRRSTRCASASTRSPRSDATSHAPHARREARLRARAAGWSHDGSTQTATQMQRERA